MKTLKFAIARALIVLSIAGTVAGCASEKGIQCRAAVLTDQKIWAIASIELRQRGYKLALGPVDKKVHREDCDYVLTISYLPRFPGGDLYVYIDQYGTLKEIINGR